MHATPACAQSPSSPRPTGVLRVWSSPLPCIKNSCALPSPSGQGRALQWWRHACPGAGAPYDGMTACGGPAQLHALVACMHAQAPRRPCQPQRLEPPPHAQGEIKTIIRSRYPKNCSPIHGIHACRHACASRQGPTHTSTRRRPPPPPCPCMRSYCTTLPLAAHLPACLHEDSHNSSADRRDLT